LESVAVGHVINFFSISKLGFLALIAKNLVGKATVFLKLDL